MKRMRALHLSQEVMSPYRLFRVVHPFKYKIKSLLFFIKLRYSLKWKLCLLIINLLRLSNTVKAMLLQAIGWKRRRRPCSMRPFVPSRFLQIPASIYTPSQKLTEPWGKRCISIKTPCPAYLWWRLWSDRRTRKVMRRVHHWPSAGHAGFQITRKWLKYLHCTIIALFCIWICNFKSCWLLYCWQRAWGEEQWLHT